MSYEFLGKDLLNAHLSKIKQRNAAYSLRAFSRDLGIDKSTLSNYLSGNRCISKNNIQKIRKTLALSDQEVDLLLSEYEVNRNRLKNDIDYIKIENEDLILFSHWQNIAVLTLSEVSEHQASPLWIAQRLGISVQEAAGAIVFLLENKYISIFENKIINLNKKVTTSNNRPSKHLKHFHEGSLIRAQKALYEVDILDRYFTTTYLASSRENIKKAGEMIHSFQRRLVHFLERAGNQDATEVLSLSIQLFPSNCSNKGVQEKN